MPVTCLRQWALRSAALAVLVPFVLAASAEAAIAQDAAQVRQTGTILLVIRDASTGLPLDAVQVLGSAPGQPAAVIARGNATGRVNLSTASLTPHGAVASIAIRRIGYAPYVVTATQLLAHVTEHAAESHDILLTPRPALLSTISVDAAAPNQLAQGTALTVSTANAVDMHERAHTSLAESLEAVEGVNTSRTGAWGSKLTVRGLGGERLAFMVDGARVNRACTFGMDQGLATVDPSAVERVEVLAGPGSTLYGSGNVGGVVNVVTRNPALSMPHGQVGGEIRAGASSAIPGGTMGAGVWTRSGRFDIALQADVQRYGDYRTPAARVDGSSYRSGTLDLKAGFELAPAQRLAFQYMEYGARDIGWPSMSGGSIPMESRRTFALDWGWQRGRGMVDAVSVRAYVQRLDHHMLMNMVMPMSGMGGMSGQEGMPGSHDMGGGGSMGGMQMTMRSTTDARSYSTTSGARAQLRLRPDSRTHIDAGVEVVEWGAEGTRWVTTSSGGMEENLRTWHTWPDVSILDLGVFAQGERAFSERLTISGGLRGDRISKSAQGWNPASDIVATGNIGARLSLGSGFGLRSSAGLGYRVPDPTELFGTVARPDGYVYRGNPELSTETGRTVEAGLTWDGAVHGIGVHEASMGITVFRNDLDDLIMPALVSDASMGDMPVREYVNVARARLTGATASLLADLSPAIRLRGSATYTRGRDITGSAPLAAVPPVNGLLALRLAPNEAAGVLPWMAGVDGWVEIEGRAAARQRRAALGAGEGETAAWSVMTLRTGATLAGTTLSLSLDNVFNRTYREHLDPVSLLRPGRNFSLRVSRGF